MISFHRDWEVKVTGNIFKIYGAILPPNPNVVSLGPTAGSIVPISYLLQNTGVTAIATINVSTSKR